MSESFGQLADRFPVKMKKGTNTISFVARNNIPVGRTVTYSRIVAYMQPQKEDTIKVLLTVGVHQIEYPVKVTTKIEDLTTFKIHINFVIFRRGTIYAGWDIGNYYLETPMGLSKYMRIHIILIPPDIISYYNSNDLVDQY